MTDLSQNEMGLVDNYSENIGNSYTATVRFSGKNATPVKENINNIQIGDPWLKEKGYYTEHQYTLGMSVSLNKDNILHEKPVNVRFKVGSLDGYADMCKLIMATGKPMRIKTIDVQMSIIDFWNIFDRLEITLFSGRKSANTEIGIAPHTDD